jgi:hypothetical protein
MAIYKLNDFTEVDTDNDERVNNDLLFNGNFFANPKSLREHLTLYKTAKEKYYIVHDSQLPGEFVFSLTQKRGNGLDDSRNGQNLNTGRES